MVQNGRWSDKETDRWRTRTRSGWWHAGVVLALLLMFLVLLVGDRHRGYMHSGSFLYWPFFIVVQTLSQVSAAFRKTASFGTSGSTPIWRDWQNFGKLHSDHWGQR